MLGVLLCMSLMVGAGLAIVLVSYYFQYSTGDAEDFVTCFMASLVWSVVIGEVLSVSLKALVVWFAASEDFKEADKSSISCQAEFARGLLAYLPCVSAKQLLPTEI